MRRPAFAPALHWASIVWIALAFPSVSNAPSGSSVTRGAVFRLMIATRGAVLAGRCSGFMSVCTASGGSPPWP
eukprot:6597434-Pyramimonas_sp.AAC.1